MIDLSKKENWTPELRYVHSTRLVIGFLLGLALGTWYAVLIMKMWR